MEAIPKRTLEGWVRRSFRIPLAGTQPHLTAALQSIGRLDIRLSTEWERIKHAGPLETNETERLFVFPDHFLLSSLWVLGAYEIIRILKNTEKYIGNLRDETKMTYELFRRMRIPIAKFEAATGYPNDYAVASPAIRNIDGALGWEISPGVMISRDELAHHLYQSISLREKVETS